MSRRPVPIYHFLPLAVSPQPGNGSREREREKRLLQRYARFSDPAARGELIDRFMPLARRTALRYARSGEPPDDLMQVACVGLLKAIDRFDPERENEFSSYAVPTIAGELRRYFRDCGWAVHLPRPDQESLLAVRNARGQLLRKLGRSPAVQEIAEAAGLPLEAVLGALEAEAAARPESLDEVIAEADKPTSRLERVGHEDERFEFVEFRATAERGLRLLERGEQQILYMRFFEELSQTEIAKRLGVSQMHVSRLLKRALEHSRAFAGEPPD